MNYPFEKYYEKASGKNIDGRGDEIASDVSKVLLRLSVQTDNWHNTRNDGSYKIR